MKDNIKIYNNVRAWRWLYIAGEGIKQNHNDKPRFGALENTLPARRIVCVVVKKQTQCFHRMVFIRVIVRPRGGHS